MIVNKLVVGPFASNCYIIGSESSNEGMIIDPGADAKEILKKVKDLRLDIKLIVLTHGHIDHIGAVKEVKEITGAKVAIHTNDTKSLQERSLATVFGLSYPHSPPPDQLLKDGDSIDIGDLHLLVLHTTGHTTWTDKE